MADPLNQYIQDIEREVAEKYSDTDYTESYVAFLDIMGMKELVNRPYAELRNIFNAVESGQALYARIHVAGEGPFISRSHLKMTVMSDAIVLSIDAGIDNAFSKLIGCSSYLIQQLIHTLDDPVFLRGGIVHGDIYQNGNIVFGPGLVAAYKLENEMANSMRCIVSQDLQEDKAVQEYLKSEGCALVVDPDDEMHFIDFVRPENREKLAAKVSQVIESNQKNDEVKEKYRWLRRYLKRADGA